MRTVVVSGLLVAAALAGPAAGRPGGKAEPIKLTAEELVKECKADPAKAEAKYKGKTLRVSGEVGGVYDDILYLTVKLGGGATEDVGVRYGKGNKPAVKTGDKATFEGKFDRVAVLGPALVECKLVREKGDKK
jgi:hypothetical protein